MLATAQKTFRRVVMRGGSPVYYARKYLEMARTLDESRTRRRVAKDVARAASPEDCEIIATLNRDGYVVLPQPLELTDELLRESRRLLSSRREAPRGDFDLSKKFYWETLLTEGDLSADSIFVRYAAQERLIRLAAMYLGEAPYLASIFLPYSFPTGQNPTHSQLWHRDADDVRIFKVFVYCTDVLTPDEGPFTVAKKGAAGWREGPLVPLCSYDDQAFKKISRPGSIEPIYGKAGTTFICDTKACFHFGSRCITNPRLACFLTYQSYAGLYAMPTPAWSCPSSASLAERLLLSRESA